MGLSEGGAWLAEVEVNLGRYFHSLDSRLIFSASTQATVCDKPPHTSMTWTELLLL